MVCHEALGDRPHTPRLHWHVHLLGQDPAMATAGEAQSTLWQHVVQDKRTRLRERDPLFRNGPRRCHHRLH